MMPFLNVYGQAPYMLEILIFQVAYIEKAIAPLERARKVGPENDMVCYISMKTFQDMKD